MERTGVDEDATGQGSELGPQPAHQAGGWRPKASPVGGAGPSEQTPLVGTLGHLAVFAWVMTLAVAAPPTRRDALCGLCLLVLLVCYPGVIRRLLRPSGRFRLWLPVLLVCVASFPVVLLFLGGADPSFAAAGPRGAVLSGLRLAARAFVLVLAVEAVTSSVDIAQIAGILERLGFRGLGFSLGVGANLLPSLHRSWVCARESLWMRGGFRNARWRALKLLFVTVVGNTLARSREIAVAAECRAYDPERGRPVPLRRGRADLCLWLGCLGSLLWVLLYP